MSDTEPWPQAEVLRLLPAVARLSLDFDPASLRADVAALRERPWTQPRIFSGDGVGRDATRLDWRSLPLRSIGGDDDRTDPGGPALQEFADTSWLAKAPYLASLLGEIPAPLRCVRLMALGPGAQSPFHSDTKCGLPWGTVRLHVPIVTTPGAVLQISSDSADLADVETICWQPGELWYADFTRPHLVRNTDEVTRIHLVIDAQVTKPLLDLFPSPFQRPEVRAATIFARNEAGLGDPQALRTEFAIPESFRSFEEPNGEFVSSTRLVPAAIAPHGERLALFIDGEPSLALVHLGNGEFRFAGWTEERTLKVTVAGPGTTEITLRSRIGDSVLERGLTGKPL
jgi:hypothetical protein